MFWLLLVVLCNPQHITECHREPSRSFITEQLCVKARDEYLKALDGPIVRKAECTIADMPPKA
jgi:hypothetical protein